MLINIIIEPVSKGLDIQTDRQTASEVILCFFFFSIKVRYPNNDLPTAKSLHCKSISVIDIKAADQYNDLPFKSTIVVTAHLGIGSVPSSENHQQRGKFYFQPALIMSYCTRE